MPSSAGDLAAADDFSLFSYRTHQVGARLDRILSTTRRREPAPVGSLWLGLDAPATVSELTEPNKAGGSRWEDSKDAEHRRGAGERYFAAVLARVRPLQLGANAWRDEVVARIFDDDGDPFLLDRRPAMAGARYTSRPRHRLFGHKTSGLVSYCFRAQPPPQSCRHTSQPFGPLVTSVGLTSSRPQSQDSRAGGT
jgi:hypothetical protein